MKKKINYTDEPLEMERIKDFLPRPEQLALKEPTVKVTLSLSRGTVDFFKSSARKHGSRYQKMIRRLLDVYASRFV
jgi:predicted DNA binding CopG/RHH family protein